MILARLYSYGHWPCKTGVNPNAETHNTLQYRGENIYVEWAGPRWSRSRREILGEMKNVRGVLRAVIRMSSVILSSYGLSRMSRAGEAVSGCGLVCVIRDWRGEQAVGNRRIVSTGTRQQNLL